MAAGHRKRTVARVLQSENAYVHDLLEVLLFRAQPRKDIYDCTTELLSTFGSLDNVLSADIDELTAVEGVGVNVAEYIKVLGTCLKNIHGVYSFGFARSTSEFCKLAPAQSRRFDENSLELFVVDRDGRVRMIIPVGQGERDKNGVLKALLPAKAYGVFALRCNGGLTDDKEEDALALTTHAACTAVGVKTYDYLVKTQDGFYSYFVYGKISGDRV